MADCKERKNSDGFFERPMNFVAIGVATAVVGLLVVGSSVKQIIAGVSDLHACPYRPFLPILLLAAGLSANLLVISGLVYFLVLSLKGRSIVLNVIATACGFFLVAYLALNFAAHVQHEGAFKIRGNSITTWNPAVSSDPAHPSFCSRHLYTAADTACPIAYICSAILLILVLLVVALHFLRCSCCHWENNGQQRSTVNNEHGNSDEPLVLPADNSV